MFLCLHDFFIIGECLFVHKPFFSSRHEHILTSMKQLFLKYEVLILRHEHFLTPTKHFYSMNNFFKPLPFSKPLQK
jgi:hypothetical protein